LSSSVVTLGYSHEVARAHQRPRYRAANLIVAHPAACCSRSHFTLLFARTAEAAGLPAFTTGCHKSSQYPTDRIKEFLVAPSDRAVTVATATSSMTPGS